MFVHLQQSLNSQSQSVENTIHLESQLVHMKESLLEQKKMFSQEKVSFEKERNAFKEAVIRFAQEVSFYIKKSMLCSKCMYNCLSVKKNTRQLVLSLKFSMESVTFILKYIF